LRLEPRCLTCGGPLVTSKFVDEWDLSGNPTEIVEDLYCSACKIRWVAFLEPELYEEAEASG